MAITLIEGFRVIPSNASRAFLVNAASGTSTWSRVANRTGGYGLAHTHNNVSDVAANVGKLRIPVLGTFSVGFAMNHVNPTPGSPNLTNVLSVLQGTVPIVDVSIGAGFGVGASLSTPSAGMSAATFPNTSITTGGWHWWCVTMVTHATTGHFRIYRDSVLCYEIAPDTVNTAAVTPNILDISLGNSFGTSGVHLADLVVRDDVTIIPNSRVDVLVPTATFANGWDGSDGNNLDNHLLIDDAGPAVDADYITTSGVGVTDTYGLNDISHNPSSVTAVQVSAQCSRASSGGRSVAVMANGTEATAVDPGNNGTVWGVFATNPSGGAAWDQTSVNAMTAGIRIKT